MEKKISVVWKGDMAFEARIDSYSVMMDSTPSSGGKHQGPTPKLLLMASLGGCTGMDVVSLAKKMRQEVESLEIILNGSLAEEHPKRYEAIHLTYEFTGKDLDPDMLRKAIDLSLDKYCGISATLKPSVALTYEIVLK